MSEVAQVYEAEDTREQPRSASTRTRICEVAAHQFNSLTYDAVSMESIALQASVARSTVYRLFTDKEDILRQIVIPVFDVACEALDQLDTDQPEHIINGIAQSYLRVWAEHRDALLFSSNIGQALFPLVQDAHDAYAAAVHNLMVQLHEARMLRNDDPVMSAILLAQTATRILKTCESHPQFENVFCHTLRGLLLKW